MDEAEGVWVDSLVRDGNNSGMTRSTTRPVSLHIVGCRRRPPGRSHHNSRVRYLLLSFRVLSNPPPTRLGLHRPGPDTLPVLVTFIEYVDNTRNSLCHSLP